MLTPRPETEMLVELALNEIKKPMDILEIGVGSGAVILSIMLYSEFPLKVLGTDISDAALKVCKKNYDSKKFRLSKHIFKTENTNKTNNLLHNQFDLIISNPPYIPDNEAGVSRQVKQYEPHLALFLPKETYNTWMLDFFHGVFHCLKDTGVALIEGHENYLANLKQLFESYCKDNKLKANNITIIKDLNSLDRFIRFEKSC